MRPSRPDVDARSLVALARYNRWANERVLDCVSRLDDAARSEPAPGTAGSIAITLAHLTDTEIHFTALVRGEAVAPFPDDLAWNELHAAVERADAVLEALIEGSEDLDRRVERDGRSYTVRDLLLQALTHSHQHRTQVAAATDLRGVPVTKTDYIDYVDAINVTA